MLLSSGSTIYNLGAWTAVTVTPLGGAVITIPGLSSKVPVDFKATTSDNPINAEVLIETIGEARGLGVLTINDFEEAYGDMLTSFERRRLIRASFAKQASDS